MGAFQNYPYADVHQLNLDWIIKKIREVRDKEDELDQAVSDAKDYAENAENSLNQITEDIDQWEQNVAVMWHEIWNGKSYTISEINNDLAEQVNNAFVDYDVVIIPTGEHVLEDTISIPERKTLLVLGDLVYDGTGTAIEIKNIKFSNVSVQKITALNGTCITVSSASGLCEFNNIYSMYLYGKNCIDITSTGTGVTGVQHINFYSSFIRCTEKCINMTSSGNGYCGEIKFFGGELNGTTGYGLYTNGFITAIRAFGLGFENLATVLELNGNNNEISLYGCRNEAAGNYVLKDTVKCFVFDGDYTWINRIDYSQLATAESIVFKGDIYAEGGIYAGTEYHITPTLQGYAVGRKLERYEYMQVYNTSGEIGGALTYNVVPKIARITTAGTFTLSTNFGVSGVQELIVYAERSGITIKNNDGTLTLFTTTDPQSVWRITSASTNSYFSPSGFLVEKITPYIEP